LQYHYCNSIAYSYRNECLFWGSVFLYASRIVDKYNNRSNHPKQQRHRNIYDYLYNPVVRGLFSGNNFCICDDYSTPDSKYQLCGITFL
jgi:hypothetical protein